MCGVVRCRVCGLRGVTVVCVVCVWCGVYGLVWCGVVVVVVVVEVVGVCVWLCVYVLLDRRVSDTISQHSSVRWNLNKCKQLESNYRCKTI